MPPPRSPLAVPHRIGFVGDWHGELRWGRHATRWAVEDGADVLVHAGDFGEHFERYYLDGLTAELARLRRHLLFVDGNHEDHRWLLRQPVDVSTGLRRITARIWHIPRGFRWTWDGVRFLGLGGAHSVDGIWRREQGRLWQKEERITDGQADEIRHGGPADVLISHDCPAGVDIPRLGDEPWEQKLPFIEVLRAREHRVLLRSVVDVVQPRMIWHGHYHRRYTCDAALGYGPVRVNGLDCNGGRTPIDNVQVVALAAIRDHLATAGKDIR